MFDMASIAGVVAAAVACFMLDMLWFGNVFNRSWRRAVAVSKDMPQTSSPKELLARMPWSFRANLTASAGLSVVRALALRVVLGLIKSESVECAVAAAVFGYACFAVPTMHHRLWSGHPLNLVAITGFTDFVATVLSAAIVQSVAL